MASQELNLIEFLLNCKESITLEYKIRQKSDTHNKYSRNWTPLLQVLTQKNAKLGNASIELDMATSTEQIHEIKTMTYELIRE
jgi:hypothetical protein